MIKCTIYNGRTFPWKQKLSVHLYLLNLVSHYYIMGELLIYYITKGQIDMGKHDKRYYTSLLSCSNSLLELSFSSIFILAISLSFILASWNDIHQNFLSFFFNKNKSTYTNILLVIIQGYFRISKIRNSMENICLQIVLGNKSYYFGH